LAISDFNNVAFIMKRLYSEKEPENLASRQRLWLTKVPKRQAFTGQSLTIPIKTGNPQSISTTVAGAQGQVGQTKGFAWLGTRIKRYGIAQVDGESILATGNKAGAFVELLEQEVNGTIDEHGRRLSNDLYGDGSGALAQATAVSGATNGTITLANADDAKNFSLGQSIVANPNRTGNLGTLRAGAGIITNVNEDAGQITFSGTITALGATDFLYNGTATVNDYDFGFFGLQAHIPLTAPSATLFLGVDRTQDVNKLSGWRLSRPGYTIEENALSLGTRIMRAGGRPDLGLIAPTNFVTLVQSLGTKVQYDGAGGDVVTGFDSVTVQLPSGRCRFYADPDCPGDRGYLLTTSSWTLRYLGSGFPHIIMDDGLRQLRLASNDGLEVRTRSIAQLFCYAPGYNGVFSIP
jgi:hypothetical protein